MKLIVLSLVLLSGCFRFTARNSEKFVTNVRAPSPGTLAVTKCELIIDDMGMEFYFKNCKETQFSTQGAK